jgi:hypothetical protein
MPNITQMHPSEHLTMQHLNVIDLLAAGMGVVKAADAIGISRHTVTRWKNSNPYFIAELNARRKELWSEAHERLRGMVTKSLDIMEAALDSGDSKIAVEVLKAVNIYGGVSSPRGSTNVDAVMAEMAEDYAKELLYSQPCSNSQSQALYGRKMLPVLTAEIFQDMKDNIKEYTGEDDNGTDKPKLPTASSQR